MREQTVQKGRKKAYLFDDSCALCGTSPIENGRIFRGHCVCDSCVEYIVNLPHSEGKSPEETGSHAADQYGS